MKRNIANIITTILISLSFAACQQKDTKTSNVTTIAKTDSANAAIDFKDGKRSPNRLFPDKLRDIPNEILAAHFPNPCYATYEDSMYVWKHNTTVQSKEDLQLIEYGSFVYTDKGWYLRVTMTPVDFEKYYHCKGGLLKKGVVYTDSASWRRSKKLIGGDAMWYYIAKDKNGRIVKGAAPIETEGKLLNALTKKANVLSSNISWTGYGELGGYSLTGDVKLKDADIEMDSTGLKSADITIDVATINHKDKHLEDHLKSEDFFDITKFPTAEFETESIQYKNATEAIATGKLTIKGITKQITVPLQIISAQKTLTVKGKISVDRTLFGIKFNSKNFFSNLGDKAIKDNFDLSFEMKII